MSYRPKTDSKEHSLPSLYVRRPFIDSYLTEFSTHKKSSLTPHDDDSKEDVRSTRSLRRPSSESKQYAKSSNLNAALSRPDNNNHPIIPIPLIMNAKWAQRSKSVQPTRDECAIFRHLLLSRDLPVKIHHSSAPGQKPKSLIWTLEPAKMAPETIRFLIPKFCTGLAIIDQPYRFVAETGLTELISAAKSPKIVLPVLPQLVKAIRSGLYSFDEEKHLFCLKLLCKITNVQDVGPCLVPFYRQLIPTFSRKSMNAKNEDTIDRSKQLAESISFTLSELERTGGSQALSNIKSLVPNYESKLGSR